MKPKRLSGSEIVKHSNKLNRVRGEYTVLEEKLFMLVHSKLTGNEKDFAPIELLTSEVCKALGTRIEHMRRALDTLMSRKMTVEGDIDDLDNDYYVIMPITSYQHKVAQKTIRIVLNPELQKYFLDLKSEFTSIIAEHCYRLNSRYSIRIYKAIMQWWSKIAEHGTWDVELNYQEMREWFCFKPEQYKRTYDFRDKILAPAIEDINKAQIGLELDLAGVYKSGREITDYIITAKKTTPTTTKKARISTKKELSDEEFIAQNEARFDELLNLELAQPELPGMPTMSKDFRIQAAKGKALIKLKAELATQKTEKTKAAKE